MNIVNIILEIFIIFIILLNIWQIAGLVCNLFDIKKLKNEIDLLINKKET